MAAHQAPPFLGFSRQEYWSGLPFPSPMHESEKWKWSRSVVSDSWRPHGLQPTRLLRPWDFPGKRTGVGCHCLVHKLYSICIYSCTLKSESENVSRSVVSNSLQPVDCSLTGSSVYGILQARILEWVACPPPGDLPDRGVKRWSLSLEENSLLFEPPGKPMPFTSL